MGWSFQLGGWGQIRHRIGLDRPANFPTLSAPDVLAIARRASTFLPVDLPAATQGLYGTEGGSFCSRVHARIARLVGRCRIPKMWQACSGASTSWGMKR